MALIARSLPTKHLRHPEAGARNSPPCLPWKTHGKTAGKNKDGGIPHGFPTLKFYLKTMKWYTIKSWNTTIEVVLPNGFLLWNMAKNLLLQALFVEVKVLISVELDANPQDASYWWYHSPEHCVWKQPPSRQDLDTSLANHGGNGSGEVWHPL